MMTTEDFEVGDLVMLDPGGSGDETSTSMEEVCVTSSKLDAPQMKIVSVHDEKIECRWLSDGHTETFDRSQLVKVSTRPLF